MTVTKRSGGWLARHQMMFRGERVFDESAVAETKSAAKALEAEFIGRAKALKEELLSGKTVEEAKAPQERLSVDQLFQLWIDEVSKNWRSANTRRIARKSFETYCIGTFNEVADDLDHKTIRTVLEEQKASGGVRGKGLGSKILRDIHRQGKAAFKWGIEEGLLTRDDNPFNRVALPSADRPKKVTAAPIEAVAATLADLEDRGSWAAPALLVMLEGGLRREEVAAVQWQDLNSNGEIRIERAAKLDENRNLVVEETKSAGSDRVVTVSLQTMSRILEKRNDDQPTDFVFGPDTGGPRRPDVITHTIRDASKRAGFPGVSPHRLRHAYATAGAKAGVPVAQLMAALGHSSIVTSQRYITSAQMDDGRGVMQAVVAEHGAAIPGRNSMLWEEVVSRFDSEQQKNWLAMCFGKIFERVGDPETSDATIERASAALGRSVNTAHELCTSISWLLTPPQSFEHVDERVLQILSTADLDEITIRLASKSQFEAPLPPLKRQPTWSDPKTLETYKAVLKRNGTTKEFLEALGLSNATAHRRRAERLARENGLANLRSASQAGAKRVWNSAAMDEAVRQSRTPQEALRRCGLIDSTRNIRRLRNEYPKFKLRMERSAPELSPMADETLSSNAET